MYCARYSCSRNLTDHCPFVRSLSPSPNVIMTVAPSSPFLSLSLFSFLFFFQPPSRPPSSPPLLFLLLRSIPTSSGVLLCSRLRRLAATTTSATRSTRPSRPRTSRATPSARRTGSSESRGRQRSTRKWEKRPCNGLRLFLA